MKLFIFSAISNRSSSRLKKCPSFLLKTSLLLAAVLASDVYADCFGVFSNSTSALNACNAVYPGCVIYWGNKNCGGDNLVESTCPTSIAQNGYCGTVFYNAGSINRPKNHGWPSLCEGNPINHGTGNKIQSETDISINRLQLIRYYNSFSDIQGRFGRNWSASYFQSLSLTNGVALIKRVDGKIVSLLCPNTGACSRDADIDFQLEKTVAGYSIKTAKDETEFYGSNGKLLSIVWPDG